MTKRLEKLATANEALKDEIARRIEAQERMEGIASISDESPNPVMRVTIDGNVVYANGPASKLLGFWKIGVGDPLPREWCKRVAAAAENTQAHRFHDGYRLLQNYLARTGVAGFTFQVQHLS